MKKDNFSHSFTTPKPANEVYAMLLSVEQWWSGLFNEAIEGKSSDIDDTFAFEAGDGAHYSKQKLVELVPGKKVAWLVTESRLSFLSEPGEWTGTRLCFDLVENGGHTKVTFTHEGLRPRLACYTTCSGAWTEYLHNLEKKLE